MFKRRHARKLLAKIAGEPPSKRKRIPSIMGFLPADFPPKRRK